MKIRRWVVVNIKTAKVHKLSFFTPDEADEFVKCSLLDSYKYFIQPIDVYVEV